MMTGTVFLFQDQSTLSQGMMKKGDAIIIADDDDAVRNSASQICMTATLSTEELFLRTQYI
jgi:hypothetical protein